MEGAPGPGTKVVLKETVFVAIGLAINSDSLLSLYLYPATIISLLPNKDNRSLSVNSRILFVRYGFPKLLYSDPS